MKISDFNFFFNYSYVVWSFARFRCLVLSEDSEPLGISWEAVIIGVTDILCHTHWAQLFTFNQICSQLLCTLFCHSKLKISFQIYGPADYFLNFKN